MNELFRKSPYVGPDFQEQIANLPELRTEILEKPMTANEIFSKPEYAVKKEQLMWTIENDDRVLRNGLENIFFMEGTDSNIWVVVAYHYEDGWHFGANKIYNNPYLFPSGCKVFSNNLNE